MAYGAIPGNAKRRWCRAAEIKWMMNGGTLPSHLGNVQNQGEGVTAGVVLSKLPVEETVVDCKDQPQLTT